MEVYGFSLHRPWWRKVNWWRLAAIVVSASISVGTVVSCSLTFMTGAPHG